MSRGKKNRKKGNKKQKSANAPEPAQNEELEHEPLDSPDGADDATEEVEGLKELVAKQAKHNKVLLEEIKQTKLTRYSVVELRTQSRLLGEALELINDRYDSLRNHHPAQASEMTSMVDRLGRDLGKLQDLIDCKLDPDKQSNHGRPLSIVTSSGKSAALSIKLAEIDLSARRVELEAQAEKDRLHAEKTLMELEEAKRRANLEARQREAENRRLLARLEAEEAKVNAFNEACSNRSVRSSRRSVLLLDDNDIVRESSKRSEGREEQNSKVDNAINSSPKDQSVSAQDLVRQLSEAALLQRLPKAEPKVFSGNALAYREWFTTFSMWIDKTPLSVQEKMHYLKQYVSGPAKDAISGFLEIDSDSAYEDAKRMLQNRYGDPFVLTEAYRDKLERWPKLHEKDRDGLRKFSDYLQHCLSAMRSLQDLEILNDVRENRKMIDKLPSKVADRWARIVADTRMKSGKFPSFQMFASFVQKESEILCQPTLSNTTDARDGKLDNAKRPQRNKSTALMVASKEPESCIACSKTNHSVAECFWLQRQSPSEKKDFVMKHGLCFSCLKTGHRTRECRSRAECKKCHQQHPTSLHGADGGRSGNLKAEKSREADQKPESPAEESKQTIPCTSARVVRDQAPVMSSTTLPVWLSHKDSPDRRILVYAMIDSQSDTSFILRQTGELLDTPCTPVTLSLSTMTSKNKTVRSLRYDDLVIQGYSERSKIPLPPLYARDYIPVERDHIPTRQLANSIPHLKDLADHLLPLQDCEVGLLIGFNCSQAHMPTGCVAGSMGEPFAVKTELGWSIVGQCDRNLEGDAIGITQRTISKADSHGGRAVVFKTKTHIKEEQIIKCLEADFIKSEDGGHISSQEDLQFLSQLHKETHQDGTDGYYYLPLPFKDHDRPHMPNNYTVAFHRFQLLERKFKRDQAYFKAYSTFMHDLINHGEAEQVDGVAEDGHEWYVPHFGVFHPKKPEKIRVVFDCAAKYRGTDLNSYLLQGPDQMNSLIGILCRFRQYSIAFMGDIEKMFHQFRVKPEDRNYLRFIWYDPASGEPATFRMCVHLFGATSSPGCATFGLRRIAEDYRHLNEPAYRYITSDFYVDDGLASVPSPQEAIDLMQGARQICAQGKLRLHKFVSNSREVLSAIPQSEQSKGVQSMDLTVDELPIERALGLEWSTETDEFMFKVSVQERQNYSRRTILSTIASVFDPLGLIAPFLLKGKLLLQELCKEKYDWDRSLEPRLDSQWERWVHDLPKLADVRLPRSVICGHDLDTQKFELHNFSDASSVGYGACSYLRVVTKDGSVHCALLLAKSRVAPLKTETIPRLELQAAVVATRLAKVLTAELTYPNVTQHFWTDSNIVLGLIRNTAKRNGVFVANRIKEIGEQSSPDQWSYVPSENNPADHASRGLTVDQLKTSNWFKGAAFLWQHPLVTPSRPVMLVDSEHTTLLTNTRTNPTDLNDRLERYSHWMTAANSIALLQNCIKLKSWKLLTPSVENRMAAQHWILRLVQGKCYHAELSALKQGRSVPRKSRLSKLDVFMDQDGLLRVGGRLRNATCLSVEERHPVILPKDSHITMLIARYYHERTFHQGRTLTASKIRSAGFWIIGGPSLVASLIQKCVTCRKLRYQCQEQKMADLPNERLDESPPFTYVGCDCFGPFRVQEGRKELKRYGLVVICMASRAIHLEILDDMTSDALINALRCVIAIRGPIRQIRSDRGSNLVGAQSELTKELLRMSDSPLSRFLKAEACEFVTNAPYASHQGGSWERQIRTVRGVLNGMFIKNTRAVDSATLRTFMYEAMAIVNSRPLAVVPSSDAPGNILTPNHLITMKSAVIAPPPGEFEPGDVYGRKRWRRTQALADQFWKQWRIQYLQSLQPRQKWPARQRSLAVGDVVLIKDENVFRGSWKTGKVVEVKTGPDGLVRTARLRASSGQLLDRAIQKLVFLFSSSDD